jgi:hypothetical protein
VECAPLTLVNVRLRRERVRGNEVVSQRTMHGPQSVLTIARSPWPTVDGPAAAPFGSGSAGLGLSQKDGLSHRCWDEHLVRFKAIDARLRGSLGAAP